MSRIGCFVKKTDGVVSVIFAVALPMIFLITSVAVNISHVQNIQRKTESSLNIVCTHIRDFIALSRRGWVKEGSDRAFGSTFDLYKVFNFLDPDADEGKTGIAELGKIIFDKVKEINGLGAGATFQYHAGIGLENDETKDFFGEIASDVGQEYSGYGAESIVVANIPFTYPFDFGIADENIEVKVNCPIIELQYETILHEDFEFLASYFPQGQDYLFSEISVLNPQSPDNALSPVRTGDLQTKELYQWSGYNFRVISTEAAQGSYCIELDSENTNELDYVIRQGTFQFVGAGHARIYRNLRLLPGKYILEFKKYSDTSNLATSNIDVYVDELSKTSAMSTIILTATNSIHNSWETFTYEFTVEQTGYFTLGFEAPSGSKKGYLDEILLRSINL